MLESEVFCAAVLEYMLLAAQVWKLRVLSSSGMYMDGSNSFKCSTDYVLSRVRTTKAQQLTNKDESHIYL